MSKEFGVFSVNDAKEIKRRVLSGNRTSLPSVNSGEQLENRYFGVLNEDLDAAANPLNDPSTAQVRIIRYLSRIERTMELVPGDSGLITIVHRCSEIEYERGTFVVIDRMQDEWYISGSDCNANDDLIEALDELDD